MGSLLEYICGMGWWVFFLAANNQFIQILKNGLHIIFTILCECWCEDVYLLMENLGTGVNIISTCNNYNLDPCYNIRLTVIPSINYSCVIIYTTISPHFSFPHTSPLNIFVTKLMLRMMVYQIMSKLYSGYTPTHFFWNELFWHNLVLALYVPPCWLKDRINYIIIFKCFINHQYTYPLVPSYF